MSGENIVPGWNEESPEFYRDLERQQRSLAADSVREATRDIHLEFAERYRELAEHLEAKGAPTENQSGEP